MRPAGAAVRSGTAVLVDDLVVRFDTLVAVAGISFAVAPGEVWLDFLVVGGFFTLMLVAATRAYPKAIL